MGGAGDRRNDTSPEMSVALAVREVGEGPPLVILHGLFGSARNWHTVAGRLAASHRVLAVDLRNHGASPWAGAMTYSEMVDDIRVLLEHRGIDRAAFLGHSLGGKTLMLFALLYGQMVDALVVVDIAPVRYGHSHLPYVEAMRAIDLAACATRSDAENQLSRHVEDIPTLAFLMQNLVRRRGAFAWRVNLEAIAADMDQLRDFPAAEGLEFDGPTLFVSGDGSNYVQTDHHARILSFFPDARFAVIPRAGHRVHADQPERFLETVTGFLDASRSGSR